MSRKANDWAWGLVIKPATLKLILLSMADRADEGHQCWPSIARLVADTSLDKKTVQEGIKTLEERGIITDTGQRRGPTMRVRVFQLNLDFEQPQKRAHSKPAETTESGQSNVPENGNIPEIGNIPENGVLNVPENGYLNVPENGVQNRSLEPVIEPVGIRTPARDAHDLFAMHAGWQPSEDAFRLIAMQVDRGFAEDAVPEFVLWWLGNPRAKPAHQGTWDQRFMARVKSQFERYRTQIESPNLPEVIPRDFWPSDETVRDLTLAGVGQDELVGYVAEFVRYWTERNEIRHAWNSKFHTHTLQRHLERRRQGGTIEDRMRDTSWAES